MYIHDKDGHLQEIPGERDFVKGGVEPGEDLEPALRCEVAEETGITQLQIIRRFDRPITFTFPEKLRQTTGFTSQETPVFLCSCPSTVPASLPDPEIDAFAFFNTSQVLSRLKYDESRSFFQENLLP